MHDTRPLPLHLTPERLADFCRQLRQRGADPAQALQQLTTVQALLALTIADRSDPAYLQAGAFLAAQLDELRDDLLTQHASRLDMALRERDAAAIARSFGALSRSGFAAAAARAWQGLDATLHNECAHWLSEWCADARRRADAASVYPDAPDFRAAGIAVECYLALRELLESRNRNRT